jgi:large subunit ribosomal protein L17
VKLQRKTAHRRSLLANLSCSLIEHGRIRTTLAKTKALRPIAERMVTLGKRGDLHARRQAIAFLRQKDAVKKLFAEVAPAAADRRGGYCRITKLGPRPSDSAPMAYIEWVDMPGILAEDEEPETTAATEETPAEEQPSEDTESAEEEKS